MKTNMQIKSMRQAGFTLIELMITVAIVAVLAAIALPAYQDYVLRAKVSEGLVLSSATKISVADAHASDGDFPTNNADAGVAPATSIKGNAITSIGVGNASGVGGAGLGIIYITLDADVGGSPTMNSAVLTLTPADGSGSIVWTCAIAADTTRYKYVPAECRN